MHSATRHRPNSASEASAKETKGVLLNGGWRYDLTSWLHDTFSFRGKVREVRQRVVTLAHIQPGEQMLDVGCGTGTLAIQVARHVGTVGRVAGIDPSSQQIARARAKAARRGFAIEFQIGVIEQLPFPDRSFDVVFSTLMIHHLPAPLKRQGLAEIVRVLKPEGRLLLADFTHRTDRVGRAAHFHAGGSRIHDLVALLKDTGFTIAETEEVQPRRFSAFPGAAIIQASISKARHESAELR